MSDQKKGFNAQGQWMTKKEWEEMKAQSGSGGSGSGPPTINKGTMHGSLTISGKAMKEFSDMIPFSYPRGPKTLVIQSVSVPMYKMMTPHARFFDAGNIANPHRTGDSEAQVKDRLFRDDAFQIMVDAVIKYVENCWSPEVLGEKPRILKARRLGNVTVDVRCEYGKHRSAFVVEEVAHVLHMKHLDANITVRHCAKGGMWYVLAAE